MTFKKYSFLILSFSKEILLFGIRLPDTIKKKYYLKFEKLSLPKQTVAVFHVLLDVFADFF